MMRGLVHLTEGGPQVSAAYTATTADDPTGGNSTGATAPSGIETSTSTTSMADPSAVDTIDSHLDSFFASSGWTREDVLVLAALVQLIAWSILLYEEVFA